MVNTAHALGAAFDVAMMSTIAGASLAGSTFGASKNAFVACAVVAVLTAVAALADAERSIAAIIDACITSREGKWV